MSDLGDEEWGAKAKIAVAVVPILKSYRELMLSGDSFSIPNWVACENERLDELEILIAG